MAEPMPAARRRGIQETVMTEYRIIETFYGEYNIQRQKKFLFFKLWETVNEQEK